MQGIEIVETNRGGKVTYHGPGQLVGYPIVARRRRRRVRAHARAGARRGARPRRAWPRRARPEDGPDYTGVWVGERKIASIGVHVARGVTTHGFAVNVENDLQPFSCIVPCGLDGRGDDLADPRRPARGDDQMPCFRKRIAYRVAQALGRRQRIVTPARLEAAVGSALSTA